MALGGVGYWGTGYWNLQYWEDDYWTEKVAVPGAGGGALDDYFPGKGRRSNVANRLEKPERVEFARQKQGEFDVVYVLSASFESEIAAPVPVPEVAPVPRVLEFSATITLPRPVVTMTSSVSRIQVFAQSEVCYDEAEALFLLGGVEMLAEASGGVATMERPAPPRTLMFAGKWDESKHPRDARGRFKSNEIAQNAGVAIADHIASEMAPESQPDSLRGLVWTWRNRADSQGFQDLAELLNKIDAAGVPIPASLKADASDALEDRGGSNPAQEFADSVASEVSERWPSLWARTGGSVRIGTPEEMAGEKDEITGRETVHMGDVVGGTVRLNPDIMDSDKMRSFHEEWGGIFVATSGDPGDTARRIALHEMGHLVHEKGRMGFGDDANARRAALAPFLGAARASNAPVSIYAQENDMEAFAELFTAVAVGQGGDLVERFSEFLDQAEANEAKKDEPKTFDQKRHPEGDSRGGQFAPEGGGSEPTGEGGGDERVPESIATQDSAAGMIAANMVASGRAPEKDRARIAGNWARILDGKVATHDAPGMDELRSAQASNSSIPAFAALEAKHGKDSVIPLSGSVPQTGISEKSLGEHAPFGSFVNVSNIAKGGGGDQPMKPGASSSWAVDGVGGILRHEYAHGLWDKLSPELRSEWIGAVPRNDTGNLNLPAMREALTAYAATRDDEAFAELIALRTSEKWEAARGDYPDWITSFADRFHTELTR